METINFLAQLWGFSFIIVGLSFLIKPQHVKSIFKFAEDEKMLLLVGVINAVLGVALLLTYHEWTQDWKALVTILNWLVLLRGVLILFFSEFVIRIMGKAQQKSEWIPTVMVVVVLLGCFLVYTGFAS